MNPNGQSRERVSPLDSTSFFRSTTVSAAKKAVTPLNSQSHPASTPWTTSKSPFPHYQRKLYPGTLLEKQAALQALLDSETRHPSVSQVPDSSHLSPHLLSSTHTSSLPASGVRVPDPSFLPPLGTGSISTSLASTPATPHRLSKHSRPHLPLSVPTHTSRASLTPSTTHSQPSIQMGPPSLSSCSSFLSWPPPHPLPPSTPSRAIPAERQDALLPVGTSTTPIVALSQYVSSSSIATTASCDPSVARIPPSIPTATSTATAAVFAPLSSFTPALGLDGSITTVSPDSTESRRLQVQSAASFSALLDTSLATDTLHNTPLSLTDVVAPGGRMGADAPVGGSDAAADASTHAQGYAPGDAPRFMAADYLKQCAQVFAPAPVAAAAVTPGHARVRAAQVHTLRQRLRELGVALLFAEHSCREDSARSTTLLAASHDGNIYNPLVTLGKTEDNPESVENSDSNHSSRLNKGTRVRFSDDTGSSGARVGDSVERRVKSRSSSSALRAPTMVAPASPQTTVSDVTGTFTPGTAVAITTAATTTFASSEAGGDGASVSAGDELEDADIYALVRACVASWRACVHAAEEIGKDNVLAAVEVAAGDVDVDTSVVTHLGKDNSHRTDSGREGRECAHTGGRATCIGEDSPQGELSVVTHVSDTDMIEQRDTDPASTDGIASPRVLATAVRACLTTPLACADVACAQREALLRARLCATDRQLESLAQELMTIKERCAAAEREARTARRSAQQYERAYALLQTESLSLRAQVDAQRSQGLDRAAPIPARAGGRRAADDDLSARGEEGEIGHDGIHVLTAAVAETLVAVTHATPVLMSSSADEADKTAAISVGGAAGGLGPHSGPTGVSGGALGSGARAEEELMASLPLFSQTQLLEHRWRQRQMREMMGKDRPNFGSPRGPRKNDVPSYVEEEEDWMPLSISLYAATLNHLPVRNGGGISWPRTTTAERPPVGLRGVRGSDTGSSDRAIPASLPPTPLLLARGSAEGGVGTSTSTGRVWVGSAEPVSAAPAPTLVDLPSPSPLSITLPRTSTSSSISSTPALTPGTNAAVTGRASRSRAKDSDRIASPYHRTLLTSPRAAAAAASGNVDAVVGGVAGEYCACGLGATDGLTPLPAKMPLLRPTDAVSLLALLTRTALRIAAPPIHLAGVTTAATGVATTAPPGTATLSGKSTLGANSGALSGVTFAWRELQGGVSGAATSTRGAMAADGVSNFTGSSMSLSQGKGLSNLLAQYIPYISGISKLPNFQKFPRLAQAPLFVPFADSTATSPSANTTSTSNSQDGLSASSDAVSASSASATATALAAAPAVMASLSLRSLLHLLYGLVLRAIIVHHQTNQPSSAPHAPNHGVFARDSVYGFGDSGGAYATPGGPQLPTAAALSASGISGHITVTPQSLSGVSVPLPVVWLLLMLLDASICNSTVKRQQLQRLAREHERQLVNAQTSDALLATMKAKCSVLELQLEEHNKALRVARVALARAKRIAELNVMARRITMSGSSDTNP